MSEEAGTLRSGANPIEGGPSDYRGLLELVGDAQVVLLGEATHGTHDFYRQRAEITRRLIEDKGFSAIAVEADWPDALRVDRFVRGLDRDDDAERSLGGFQRFPNWMWRNADVLDFIGWLRFRNDRSREQVGFYGLDLYGLERSVEMVVDYLERVDPVGARRARDRYSCFEGFGGVRAYGWSVAQGLSVGCRRGLVRQLEDLVSGAAEYLGGDGRPAREQQFFAEESARAVIAAEEYYTAMFTAPTSSWNLRDSHMAGVLRRLVGHLRSEGTGKTVVWAHNSHVGDALHTEMARRGEHNLGQLVRKWLGRESFNIGFTTYQGTVSAASEWGGPVQRKRVREALPGSVEELFHETGLPAFWLAPGADGEVSRVLDRPRLQRAIGVIYRPERERASHYFDARLGRQFDAVVHIDSTRAVEPLEPAVPWRSGEPPETYPTAV